MYSTEAIPKPNHERTISFSGHNLENSQTEVSVYNVHITNQFREGGESNLLAEMNVNTLQSQNAENLKQIFPEKEYRGLSPNFFHVSVSELYIPTMGLPILLQEIYGPILGLYKSLTDKLMWKLGRRPRNSQKRNT